MLTFLPGTLCDKRVFHLLRMSKTTDAVFPTLRGAKSARDMAAHLLQTLPRRLSLVGFSLGGIVALEMIAQQPQRIERLALIATNARPDPPENVAARRDTLAVAGRLGLARFTRERLLPLYFAGDAPEDDARLLIRMAEDVGLDAFRDQTEIAINRIDSRPRLSTIDVPTLVICGGRDVICPVDRHEEIASRIPNARLRVVADAGHFPLLDNPMAVDDALAEWLSMPPRAGI